MKKPLCINNDFFIVTTNLTLIQPYWVTFDLLDLAFFTLFILVDAFTLHMLLDQHIVFMLFQYCAYFYMYNMYIISYIMCIILYKINT
jgi:hypothetical protein